MKKKERKNFFKENFYFIAALMALKRKKLYEAEIDKMMNTRMNLETQLIHIENASVNLETLSAMQTGAKALKNLHGAMYYFSLFNSY